MVPRNAFTKDKDHDSGGYLLPDRSAHHGLPLYLWIQLHSVRRSQVEKEAVALLPSNYARHVYLRSRSFLLLLPRPMASPDERPVLLRREGYHAGKLSSNRIVHSIVNSRKEDRSTRTLTPSFTLPCIIVLILLADLHRAGFLWTICPFHRGLQYVARNILFPRHQQGMERESRPAGGSVASYLRELTLDHHGLYRNYFGDLQRRPLQLLGGPFTVRLQRD